MTKRQHTHDETAYAVEPVHKIESPSYKFLKEWGRLSHNEVERPIGSSREGDALCANGERHDLWRVQPRYRPPTEGMTLAS
jgi:hypothetical protein